jgi:hypothetical protein
VAEVVGRLLDLAFDEAAEGVVAVPTGVATCAIAGFDDIMSSTLFATLIWVDSLPNAAPEWQAGSYRWRSRE